MKNKLSRVLIEYWDIIGIAVLYFILHLFMHTDYWDDIGTTQIFVNYNGNIFQYLKDMYMLWSSRIFIQAIWPIVGYFPNMVWKILDVLIICIWYYYFKQLILLLCNRSRENNKERIIIVGMFCAFPYALMGTAGWMTTTMVYTWTFAASCYFIYLLFACINEKKIRWYEYLIYGITVLYSGNFNVTSIGFVVLFILMFRKSNKRAYWILWSEGMLLTLLNLGLFLLAPGNKRRNIQDAKIHGTADVLDLPLFGKIRMGVNSTFYHFISVPNVILFVFCVIVGICAMKYYKSVWLKVLAWIPLLIDIIWTGYAFIKYTVSNRILTYIYPDAVFQTCSKKEQYLAFVSAGIMLGLLCFFYITMLSDLKLKWVGLYSILIWGVLPVMALGFTATVSTSIIRMVSFLYISFMFCGLILILKFHILEDKQRVLKWNIDYNLMLIIIVFTGVILNVLQVIRHIVVYG